MSLDRHPSQRGPQQPCKWRPSSFGLQGRCAGSAATARVQASLRIIVGARSSNRQAVEQSAPPTAMRQSISYLLIATAALVAPLIGRRLFEWLPAWAVWAVALAVAVAAAVGWSLSEPG